MITINNIRFSILFMMTLAFSCSKNEDQGSDDDNGSKSGLTLVEQVSLKGPGEEFGIDIITTPNGYVICGVSENERPYLIAIDNNLKVLWDKDFGVTGVGGFEKIIQTNDGNYIAAGFTEIDNIDFNFDLYVVKVNESGEVIWETTSGYSYVTDTTVDLIEAKNGDIYIAGSKLTEPLPQDERDEAETDILVIKIDANGNLIWGNIYGGEENETLSSILLKPDGDLLIGGTYSYKDPEQNGPNSLLKESDVIIYKITSTGSKVDEKTFGSSENDGTARLYQLQNGEIAVLSSSNGSDGDVSGTNMGGTDLWLFTLDNDLNIKSQVSIGGNGFDMAVDLNENNDNEILLVGSTNSDAIAGPNDLNDPDVWILKLSSSFNVLEELTIGGSDSDFSSGALFKDDMLVIVASSNSTDGDVLNNNGDWDIWVTFIEDLK